MKFIFDLDGTVTSQETLPLIANHFGVQEEIAALTQETVQGNIPFIESFIKRVRILGQLPISKVSSLLETANVYPELLAFIKANSDKCVVATGNLWCWCDRLLTRIGCEAHCSESVVENDTVVKLTKILRKELVVEKYQKEGCRVVYIGDGNNDLEAMRTADVAIAVGMTHRPSKSLMPVTDYLVFSEKALCRQLNQLL